MLNSLQTTLHIGLSRTSVTLFRSTGLLRRQTSFLGDRTYAEESAPELLAARLGDMLAEHQCSDSIASIVLSDECVRLMMVTPPTNAARLQDCKAAAHLRYQALYGGPPAGWALAGDWNAAHPFLACAIPQSLSNALIDLTSYRKLKLARLAPQFITAWNRWRHKLAANAWFGIAHREQLTLGALAAGRLQAVRVVPMPLHAWQDEQMLTAEVNREALRLNLPAPESLQLCGDIPGHWLTTTIGTLSCTRLDAAHRTAHGQGSLNAALALAGMRR